MRKRGIVCRITRKVFQNAARRPNICLNWRVLDEKRILSPDSGYDKIETAPDKAPVQATCPKAGKYGRKKTMKKVICKVEYDTEASELIQKKTSGVPGDPAGYEESLYKTADGKLFLYVNGGPESPYTEEGIKRMSAAKAEEWKNA